MFNFFLIYILIGLVFMTFELLVALLSAEFARVFPHAFKRDLPIILIGLAVGTVFWPLVALYYIKILLRILAKKAEKHEGSDHS